jgi:hypothetical protein
MIDTNNLNLHIIFLDKFIPSFIDFINQNFPIEEHLFVIYGKAMNELEYNPTSKNVIMFDTINKFFHIIPYISIAKRIIIHGLFFEEVVNFLNQMPQSILDKVYWVMWGGDFYFPEMHSNLKKQLIMKIKNVITYIDGDVDYLKKNYRISPLFHKCLMYLSNVFDENKYKRLTPKNINGILILVGNSASETNRHEFIFDKLHKFSSDNIKLIVPLSYGDNIYRERIINIGKKIFDENFYPLTEFLPYDKYLEIIFSIDIAIFANNRQQGMGNLIQLLGLGKKVYLNPETSQWNLCQNLGIKVYDINGDIDLNINTDELENNKNIVREWFSIENLIKQWQEIFNG